jgi:hypothetical protein
MPNKRDAVRIRTIPNTSANDQRRSLTIPVAVDHHLFVIGFGANGQRSSLTIPVNS